MVQHLIPQGDSSFAALKNSHGSTGAPVWELVKVTASSILEVVILSVVGYFLARRGIIDKITQGKINKINVSFFTPALLFSKVAFTLNPARLAELLIVPIGFVLVIGVSALSAFILSGVARLPRGQRNFAIAVATTPNSNSLPVALMQSLVIEVPQLHWEEEGEPEDTTDGMLGRALTYLVLFSTLGMFLRWSVGARLLSSVEDDEDDEEQEAALEADRYRDQPGQARVGQLVDVDDGGRRDQDAPEILVHGASTDGQEARPAPQPLTGDPEPVRRQSKSKSRDQRTDWVRSFPNTPNTRPTSVDGSISEDGSLDEERDLETWLQSQNDTAWTRFQKRAKRVLHAVVVRPAKAILDFMTAPLWAAVLSLVVALISPLQKFLDGIEPLVGALRTSGACSIPLTMLVLGAYFVQDKKAVDTMRKNQPQTDEPSRESGAAASTSSTTDSRDSATQRWATNQDAPASNTNSTSFSKLPWMRNPWSSSASELGSSYAPSDAGGDSAANGENDQRLDEAANNANSNSLSKIPAWRKASQDLTPFERRQRYAAALERRTIVVSIASRMIICPIVLIPLLTWYALATRQNVVDDPVFIAAAALIIGSPPALTLAQITSSKASGNQKLQRLISRTIFVSYAFLAAPTTIILVLAALLIAENDHAR